MKFTVIFLIVCFLQAGASGLSQTLTLKFTNAPLNEVFRAIEKQSDYSFVYGKEQLLTAKKVNLDLSNVSIENALPVIFKDQPLEYTISGRYIAIRKKIIEADTGQALQTKPPPVQVTGRVVNEKGEPLQGITIVVKGYKHRNTNQ